jgi:hypothetical protein
MPAEAPAPEVKPAGETAAAAATTAAAAKPTDTAQGAVSAPAATATSTTTKPDAASDAAKAAAAAAPVEVKLALPKDAAIDQARVDELAAFAKANGLSQAAAEKLLERENAGAAAVKTANEAANVQALADAKAAWMEAAKADKAIAGPDGSQLVASKELATKALLWHKDPELDAMLANTGFGEHPVVIRLLKHVGQALGEDGLRPAGNGAGADRSTESLLYGSTKG